jgi:hypothetical protein
MVKEYPNFAGAGFRWKRWASRETIQVLSHDRALHY